MKNNNSDWRSTDQRVGLQKELSLIRESLSTTESLSPMSLFLCRIALSVFKVALDGRLLISKDHLYLTISWQWHPIVPLALSLSSRVRHISLAFRSRLHVASLWILIQHRLSPIHQPSFVSVAPPILIVWYNTSSGALESSSSIAV